MSNSQLVIGNDTCGCNQVILAEGLLPAGDILSTPQKLFYAYQQPKAEAVKIRQENGSARLNFRVNKWDIVVNLGNNAKELAKMIETLELVKNDSMLPSPRSPCTVMHLLMVDMPTTTSFHATERRH